MTIAFEKYKQKPCVASYMRSNTITNVVCDNETLITLHYVTIHAYAHAA